MSVIITCDIHHLSLGTDNQKLSDRNEAECAIDFLGLLNERGLCATYFISGKAFEEDYSILRPALQSESIEIGGHTYDCFERTLAHRISKKALSSYPGPRWLERRSIAKTQTAAHSRGRHIEAWRNHMYLGGKNTSELLLEREISLRSDEVRRDADPRRDSSGLWHFPINVIPDHEHIYHAERTRQWVSEWQARYGFADDWGSESYEVEQWCDIALDDLRRNQQNGRISTILLHPITMYLADRYNSAIRLLDYISELGSKSMKDSASFFISTL